MIDWFTGVFVFLLLFISIVYTVLFWLSDINGRDKYVIFGGLCFIVSVALLLSPNVVFCDVDSVEGCIDNIDIDEGWIHVAVDGMLMECSVHSDVASKVLSLKVGDSATFTYKVSNNIFFDRLIIVGVEV